ncbi:MAG: hypothetical protein PHV59_05045, partial [Victivallales bacterium]|nr:hypothetical protein [Victivallales bacterium]
IAAFFFAGERAQRHAAVYGRILATPFGAKTNSRYFSGTQFVLTPPASVIIPIFTCSYTNSFSFIDIPLVLLSRFLP